MFGQTLQVSGEDDNFSEGHDEALIGADSVFWSDIIAVRYFLLYVTF
jgi:hypothetical protein